MKTFFLQKLTKITKNLPLRFLCFLLLISPLETSASTVISGTLTITNHAALTNATSGQSYTLNSDTRTFTNAVANAATQIRVRTNDSAATILLSIAAQAGAYPFTGIPSLTVSAGTNITFRATNDTALTITLSPTNWGKVTYSTQTVGVVQSIIRVPQSAEASGVSTGLMSQLAADLNTYNQDRTQGRAEFNGRVELDAGFGLHQFTTKTNYTVTTNDLVLGADVATNALTLTLPSAASSSNHLFLVKDINGAAATNNITLSLQSGDRIDGATNRVLTNNFGSLFVLSRGGTNFLTVSGGTSSSGGSSLSVNGTSATDANITNTSTMVWGILAATNVVGYPTNLANAQISGSAAIAKSKISSSGTWTAAEIPALQTVADGGANTIKMKGYLVLASPFISDGAGARIVTNDNSAAIFGQALFANAGAASTNWVEYRVTVPEDIDTSVDLKVERFKFRLGGSDTGAHSYVLTQAAVADSASYDSPSLSQSVTLSFAGDGSGASGDVETISNVTLTNWAGNVTAGRLWVIRLARNGDTDASTVNSYSGPLVISYGITQ